MTADPQPIDVLSRPSTIPDSALASPLALHSPALEPPVPAMDAQTAGVSFALSGLSLDAGRNLLKAVQDNRRVRLHAQLAGDIERTRADEHHALQRLARARAEFGVIAERLRWKNALEDRATRLGAVIRQKRHDMEAKKIADEVERLEQERRATVDRLGNDRAERHRAELASWKERAEERSAQTQQLLSTRKQLAIAEAELRAAAAPRMNRWMTRTASGFLVWAGYTVIGTTGIAVASLLDDGSKRSLLTDVATSAAKLMNDFGGGALHPMVAAPLAILAFLLSVAALIVGMDALMRWFDERWLKPGRTASNGTFSFPTKEELSRKTFSKLLITIPFIYISSVLVAFIAYGGRMAGSLILIGNAAAVLNAMIGSALSLLAASIFLLYFANILEPRATTGGLRWRTRWEIGIVPFFMVGAILLIAAVGPHSPWAWAGVTIFMLLGAMALAYGLLYRGMFGELDYASRAVTRCDQQITAIMEPPAEDEPGKAEKREVERVLADYRARRQYLFDLDRERRLRRAFLTSDQNDTMMVATYQVAASALWRVWMRLRGVGPQPEFYRATDFEAAPLETAERQQCEERIRYAGLELRMLPDSDAARASKELCERDYERARQERETAERQPALAVASLDEREAEQRLAFEEAYQIGRSTKHAYDIVVYRREQQLAAAQRPRVIRPARSRAEEVLNGH
jgi:hypothetical protein